MKMKWIALLPLAVVFAGLLVPDASLSCSCEPPGTPLEELALYDAVFTGRVVEIAAIAGTPDERMYGFCSNYPPCGRGRLERILPSEPDHTTRPAATPSRWAASI